MFKNYIREFLKIKIEATGWNPELCHLDFPSDQLPDPEDQTLSEEQRTKIKEIIKKRQEFLDETFEIYGINIDSANMKKNLGLRYIAKVFID